MTTSYPTSLAPTMPVGPDVVPSRSVATGAWRYAVGRSSRAAIAAAMLVSASLHVVLLFGFSRAQKKAPRALEDRAPVIRLTIPEIKDLEEPEPIAVDDS